VKRSLVLLLMAAAAVVATVLLGAAGPASVAGAAQTPLPTEGRSTYEGEIVSVSCAPGEQILQPVATYYDKHGDVIEVVTQPFVAAVNPYGEVVSAGFLTPKKAVWVVLTYSCAPQTQPTPPPTVSQTPTPPPTSPAPAVP
jgi:hypothetical protein